MWQVKAFKFEGTIFLLNLWFLLRAKFIRALVHFQSAVNHMWKITRTLDHIHLRLLTLGPTVIFYNLLWLTSLKVFLLLLSLTLYLHQGRHVRSGLHRATDHVGDPVQEARGRGHRDIVLCRAADDVGCCALRRRQVALLPQVFSLQPARSHIHERPRFLLFQFNSGRK